MPDLRNAMSRRRKDPPLPSAEDLSPMSYRSIVADAKAIAAAGIRAGLMRMPAKNTLLEAEIRSILHGERKH